MRRTASIRLALAAPAALLALSACGPVNRGLESVHQPVVQRTDYVFDLAAGGYGLAPGEEARLVGWFEALRLGYGDRITVDDGVQGGGGAAREAVAAAAARHGLLLGDTAPVTEGALPPGMVRVVVSRSNAAVPGCPDWRDSAGPNFAGSTSASYGCATNGNLAAMVADPQDLLRGRDGQSGGPDARASARALKAYREAPPTGAGGALKQESAGSAGGR
ncbi:CpaD family pilus assembly lipoprotein [Sphingomonas jatrophae]|uniref:Pilus assembly protein CpaD n=1 Tax=Sphingomonas jatrophae TaxID=1166337 RepID=A0A1I6JU62_9SPHN|nr:CpaD family pilus assembly lipoprotein [Sphingomonas jatrophae]SFR82529.1 pilus assembly protein CpaD [Sphingomonas jatrophae]